MIAKLKDHGISQIPVMKDGELIGMVTEVALLRYLASGEYSLASAVEALAESDYATRHAQHRHRVVQSLLGEARIAIVLDGDEIVGVITKIDLIEYLARGRAADRSCRRSAEAKSKRGLSGRAECVSALAPVSRRARGCASRRSRTWLRA